jgi:formate dehydrogenase maturation protein FdhE
MKASSSTKQAQRPFCPACGIEFSSKSPIGEAVLRQGESQVLCKSCTKLWHRHNG